MPKPLSSLLCVMLACAGVFASLLHAQVAPPPNGPRQVDPGRHALVGATVVTEPGETIEDATVVIDGGVIRSVRAGGEPPRGARVWDCAGLTIYPGLIDPYVEVAAPARDASRPGAHWNDKVLAERSVLDGEGLSSGGRERLRGMGFTVAGLAPDSGVFRGRGAVVLLGEDPTESDPLARVVRDGTFHVIALERGGWSSRTYPGSKMGVIALVRQTLSDVEWNAAARAAHERDPANVERPARVDALDALADDLPLLFTVDDEQDALRVGKIADEFGRSYVLVGSGSEYQRMGPVAKLGASMIVPMRFAAEPKITSPADRDAVSLRELMAWEQSPTNVRRLIDAGVDVSLTTSKLPEDQKFWSNVRRAIKHGLSEDDALAAMTVKPASLLGLEDRIGRIAPGYAANLTVVDGGLFEKGSEIRDVWIDGRRYEINGAKKIDLEGSTWAAMFDIGDGVVGEMKIGSKNRVTIELPGAPAPADEDEAADDEGDDAEDDGPSVTTVKTRGVSLLENRLSFVVSGDDLGGEAGAWMLAAVIEGDVMHGGGMRPDGGSFTWSASRTESDEDEDADDADSDEGDEEGDDEDESDVEAVPDVTALPFGAYGFESLPAQEELLLTGATIWTSGPDGIIENGALHVRRGKIVQVGRADRMGGVHAARKVDVRGKHITPGLIDCHSHTGISGGVNEGTQSVTSEVRIFDVIDPDDVNWYRQLAGGLTAANQLHGSANAIGGQNSVVKLRWGVGHPDGMRLEGAPGGIKFALGENVKQSNWGDDFRSRYPQTRMGVETIIRDRFIAAREYAAAREAGDPLVRRELELEALAEILAGDRLIHCHSYRQDEILMLCRIAEEFGFRIGTFQHVLEGYKVAEAIRDHAIGGSSFSDWWAYKFEVVDAIPHNGALMHDVGVVVSFNSDSDELARRMNAEAAKAVKYGGVDPAEALKFVTLNPATQLGVEDRIGSLEKGKDADFVIWSGSPLSTLTRCEATYVDGRAYFSLERDAALRAAAASERERLIQKLLDDGEGDRKPGRDVREPREEKEMIDSPPSLHRLAGKYGYGVELKSGRVQTADEMMADYLEWMQLNGLNVDSMHPGECGCALHNLLR